MTTEPASAFQCIKVGAGYACIWGFGVVCLLVLGGLQLLDQTLSGAILIGSLAAVAVGIPVFRDDKFRNPGAIFFLLFGPVLVSALLAVLAALAFGLYLLLDSGGSGHR
jgi:hypothetical protein